MSEFKSSRTGTGAPLAADKASRERVTVDTKYWEILNRISAHEAMYEERTKTIFSRLARIDASLDNIQRNMFVIGLTLLTGMAGLIATLLLK